MLDKKSRILILVDLLKIEAIFKGPIAGFLNILLKGLTAHSQLMPDSILLDRFIKKPRDIK
ncbi:hypothetical protein PITC_001600 [Penicillium italicum]|uniref:Uncharacterized protein n=1 Tax=Penicillium italicum TaxID=40296 RepID=A0A0A2LFE8_PENIT|nr:hypothetical protein PITC_001600 [Penicillium italicum]